MDINERQLRENYVDLAKKHRRNAYITGIVMGGLSILGLWEGASAIYDNFDKLRQNTPANFWTTMVISTSIQAYELLDSICSINSGQRPFHLSFSILEKLTKKRGETYSSLMRKSKDPL